MDTTTGVDLSRVHVLVLDDNKNFISIMRSILRGFGVRHILEARDALQAMELMRHHPVDIAFADLKMPIFTGVEFAKFIRTARDSPNRRLPIVLVTANASRSAISDAINAGIEGVIAKPIAPKSVYDCINRLLQGPAQYIEVEGYYGPCRRRRVDPAYTGPERRAENQAEDGEVTRTLCKKCRLDDRTLQP